MKKSLIVIILLLILSILFFCYVNDYSGWKNKVIIANILSIKNKLNIEYLKNKKFPEAIKCQEYDYLKNNSSFTSYEIIDNDFLIQVTVNFYFRDNILFKANKDKIYYYTNGKWSEW